MPGRVRAGLRGAVATAVVLAAGACAAQAVYRSVGPDGRVTYSDRPMPAAARAGGQSTAEAPQAAGATAGNGAPSSAPASALPSALPFVLREPAARFPVVLYTGPGCTPCDSARQLLAARGVPFSERTVQSNADIEALGRLTGDTSLPVATIGGQRLRGFAPDEWTQYLDSAGYPRTSQLPPGYRGPAPQPLVAQRAASADSQPPAEPERAAPPPRPAATAAPANPAGIVF